MSVKIKRSDLTPDQSEMIRKYLCLQPVNTNYHSGKFFQPPPKEPVIFYIIDAENVYLPYTFASALFQKPVNQELPHPTTLFNFTGSLFDHQVPVAEESLSHIQTKGSTTVGLYPGFGKTVIGAYLAAKAGLYTVVLYHREFLGNQWDTTFREFTNATRWIVGTPTPSTFPQITFCMDTKIGQLPDVYREKIGFVIVDEAHAFCTPSRVHCLLGWQPKYVVAETATLIRDDGMHSMIQAITGSHGIFKISTKPFTVIKLNTGIEPETKSNVRGQLDWAALIRSICMSEPRNRMILSMVERNPTHKILILTSLVDHVKILHTALVQMGEKVDFMAGTKKSYSDSRILLGTISKIGAGFDEKTACPNYNGVRIDMLILVTSMKSQTVIEQSVGRVFRADMPIVVDFVDNNATLKRHWAQRKKWYISRSGTIQEMSMRPNGDTVPDGTGPGLGSVTDGASESNKAKSRLTKVYTITGESMVAEIPDETIDYTPDE